MLLAQTVYLADSIPGISDLPGYGIVGVLMAIIVGGCAVIIVALWRALSKKQAELDTLNELIREKYVGALTTALNSATEQHDLVTILREELRQRPRR